MALSLDKARLNNLADEIWKSAQRLRGKFKAYEYQNVILPIIVIRRLECVLLKWRADKKAEIRAKKPKISDKELDALVKKLGAESTVGAVFKQDRLDAAQNLRRGSCATC